MSAKIIPISKLKDKEWRLVKFTKGELVWFEIHQYGMINKDSLKMDWIPVMRLEDSEVDALKKFEEVIAPVESSIIREV